MLVFTIEYTKLRLPCRLWLAAAHLARGWLLFPLRYLDLVLLRSPYCERIGGHFYLWLHSTG